ncbi:protein TRM32-like isoform X2 [Silene latifolia]|uniref:protein TRM32-like isoform X2 n=1 Tax=Silene latifolia TaxID=37657 RepID=UPI003D778458
MGKHLWKKQSYVRVEKEDPGCVWTVFRLMNYHPWHNVKKMLPYINQKPHKSSFKVTDEPIEFHDAQDSEEDAMTNYSAFVTSSPSRSGSGSKKRSIKARIKALLADKPNKSGKVNTIQEHELLALKEACNDFGAPTLISLLKANPKLLSTLNPVDDSTNLTRTTSVNRPKDSKDEYVGVLELFKVDQEVFLKILQDSPPKKKHRLVKSGSFPFSKSSSSNSSTLGRTPSKLEHKHNEVWPTPNQGYELRKAKSHNIVRSSSLKDSLEKYGRLIDTTTSNNKRVLNKELSKSLKLTNEKEFALSDQHGRRSFRERMFMPEDESEAPRASLDCFLNHISRGDDVRVLRLDSPPGELNGQSHKTTPTESNIDTQSIISFGVEQGEGIPEVKIVEVTEDHNRHRNEGTISSISGSDVECQLDQIECVDWPTLEESSTISHSTSTLEIGEDVQENHEMDNCSENLQYVKYVLDIIGFTTTSNELLELEAWHSPDQPLDPAIFDGIEICCPFEPKPSSNKEMIVMSSFQRKILFDLINEALFVIHENSYAYYPKALTYSCTVHPELKGKSRVVEQIWEFVDEWVTWTPEVDVELNVAVAHDLSRHKNGWSNLQTDCELLAIDLEDWIFSELLDEIVGC